MRIFKTKWFNRWARRERLNDSTLRNAIADMARGLVDTNLGGHVYKQRVPVQGRGKSGGLRTLIAFRLADKAFFMYGFAKNKQANIANDELRVFRVLAAELLEHKDETLQRLMVAGELIEVESDERY